MTSEKDAKAVGLFGAMALMLSVIDPATRRGFFLIGIGSVFCAFLETFSVGMFLPLMQLLLAPESVARMPVLGKLLAPLMGEHSAELILTGTLGLTLFFVFKNILLGVLNWQHKKFVYVSEARFQTDLFAAYMRSSYLDAVNRNTAEATRTLVRSVPVMFTKGLMPSIEFSQEALLALGAVVALMLVEPMGTLVAGGTIGLVGGLYFVIVRGRLSRWGQHIEQGTGHLFKAIALGFGVFKAARVLGRERFFIDHFGNAANNAAHYSYRFMGLGTVPRLLGEVIVLLAISLLVLMVHLRGQPISDVLPVMGVFAAAAFRILPSMNRMLHAASTVRQSVPAIDDVRAALALVNLHGPAEGPQADEVVPLPFTGELVASGLSFRYPGRPLPALTGVDLTVRQGEMVALVGRSGSGKSTLADLLLGLLTPEAGAITVDGIDIRDAMRAWQRRIAYVPQSIFVADDSLARNVALGLPDAAIDRGRVLDALTAAQLGSLLDELPDGLDTRLGENGSRLSGGQRQRIGIARALYEGDDVMILDEATSALDNKTEHELAQVIEALRGERTIIVIAHRLATVRRCDRVVMMDEGRVIGAGRYDALVASCPTFAHMTALAERGGHDDLDEVEA
jgi:ABC-type multidrug transport system fused ATPase/permease subunit